jgi:hypothetical protein
VRTTRPATRFLATAKAGDLGLQACDPRGETGGVADFVGGDAPARYEVADRGEEIVSGKVREVSETGHLGSFRRTPYHKGSVAAAPGVRDSTRTTSG